MNIRKIFAVSALLLLVFLIQVAGLSNIHLPFGGFSLYLITLIILISLQDGIGCVVVGFVGGFIYDLNPTISSPMGEWALLFTLLGYFFMSFKPALHDMLERPVLALIVFAFSMISILTVYQLLSSVLGNQIGNLYSVVLEIVYAAIWSFLVSPIILPSLQKFNNLVISEKER